MIIVQGDLLDAPIKYIAHQVNCQGVMGGGVALQIKHRYPKVFDEYKEFIKDYRECNLNEPPLGIAQICDIPDDTNMGLKRCIVNIFGQDQYGRGKQFTDYDAVYSAFEDFHDMLIADYGATWESQVPVAIPYMIGCGLGGGDWGKMTQTLKRIEKDFNILFICCEL